jgi:hypothetical protein
MGHAHEAVNQEARRKDADARTVAVAMFAQGNRADWAHAGDCRLYHIRNREIQSRTRDDSVVQVLFEQGTISEAEMGSHEDQNRLLQALGGDDAPKPRLGGAEIEPGDVLLLCSDGFWENLEPSEITQLAANPPGQWRQALEAAVQLAVQRGGQKADNTSVILARYGEANAVGRLKQLWRFTLILLLFASLTWASLQSPLKGRLEPFINEFRQWWEQIGFHSKPVATGASTETSSYKADTNLSLKGSLPAQAQDVQGPMPTLNANSPPGSRALEGQPNEPADRVTNSELTLPIPPTKP